MMSEKRPITPEQEPDRETLLQFLRGKGAARVGHSERDLLEHLWHTSEILRGWALPAWVCTAGLFHSVYGTEVFTQKLIPLQEREELRALIGRRAEKLVYCFSVLRRAALFSALKPGQLPPFIVARATGHRIYLAPGRMTELCCLLAANWLEQQPRRPASLRARDFTDYLALAGSLPPAARRAMENEIAGTSSPASTRP